MAAVNHTGNNHGTGSRANSLEPVTRPLMDAKQDRLKEHRDEEEGALGVLAAAGHRRQRSIRYRTIHLIIQLTLVTALPLLPGSIEFKST